MVDYSALINQAAAEGPNMNEAVKGGGGDRTPPAEGMCRLRFISYIEIGKHEEENRQKGTKQVKELVKLQFELSGPKHQPTVLDDGRKIPHVITITLPLSLNEKANFYKLFRRMNHTGEYRHMAQMLGQEFLGTVVHKVSGEGTDKRTYANLRDDSGFTIRPPFVEDPETGESRRVQADPQITPTKCFLWNYATKEMWDALFIDGRYDDKTDESGKVIKEGASKNYWQNLIKSALDFAGSPIGELLFAGEADLPESTKPERSEEAKQAAAENDANADPLADVA